MRDVSQKTKLAILADHVDAWRKRAGSRETVAVLIVEAHQALGGDKLPKLDFDMSGDAYTCAKNAADRIFRWLDDRTKDNNFMPANFEDSVLVAMPEDIRIAYLNEWLGKVGVACRMRASAADTEVNPSEIVQAITRVNHRTEAAAADLLDGIDPGELPRLHNSLLDEITVKKSLVGKVESAMRKTGESVSTLLKKVAG
ncbi:hypothetical protein [Paraburkholderia xenovorans]|uniref:hypothetical protein n=1 Tax=Paraburkholderia xenovorans TaxID=36873 RepID=UPI0015C524BD|nr:hypothetical protein [Paraburkholderia xenovorans]NPT38557.1 hypothetical protein [Paraburkholderia xenovorans]